jgi:hypothetical protein
MIDNIDIIKPLLNFSEEGDFYMLYVMKRKKDQPEGEKENHQSVRSIKTYCVDSIEYLEKRYEEIKMLCNVFNARAYIHVQKQNHRDVSLNMMVELADRIRSQSHNQRNLFESVVGQMKTLEKRWIVDIDTKDDKVLTKIISLVNLCRPETATKIEAIVPTKSGYHLITSRFDVEQLKKYMSVQGDTPDIQKKNPTMLFCP